MSKEADILLCSGASAEFLRKKIISTTLVFQKRVNNDLIRALNLD